MKTKIEQAKENYNLGNYKKAFFLTKNFNKIFNKSELRSIQISYESLSGKEKFYKQLGINTKEEIKKSIYYLRKL